MGTTIKLRGAQHQHVAKVLADLREKSNDVQLYFFSGGRLANRIEFDVVDVGGIVVEEALGHGLIVQQIKNGRIDRHSESRAAREPSDTGILLAEAAIRVDLELEGVLCEEASQLDQELFGRRSRVRVDVEVARRPVAGR